MGMRKSGCAIAILFVALCGSMFVNLVLLSVLAAQGGAQGRFGKKMENITRKAPTPERRFDEMLVRRGSSSKRIVVIPLEGIIATGHSNALGSNMVSDFPRALQQALDDDSVKAIVVAVNSPGGELTASDILYNALAEFSKEKPAVVFFNSVGASGAYYMACGGTQIMCHPTTFTGSIGVIISTLNYRSLFDKIGLESVVFKSGKFKDLLSGGREMTEEERNYVQGMVTQSYERFLNIVATARNLDKDALRNGAADGRILSGTDALTEKLVDALGYIDDGYAKAAALAGVENPQIVRYKRSLGMESFFDMFGEAKSNKVQVKFGNLSSPAVELLPGHVYLLPAVFAQ